MSTEAAPTTVFVYGTLMPGERNAHVAGPPGTHTAQPATLRGFTLLHLHPEGYPALIPGDPGAQVKSPVSGYALTYAPQAWASALPHLDHLEGLDETPPLYSRERVMLRTEVGELEAWVYLYARPERLKQPGATVMPGGDWRDIPERHQRGPDER